MTKQEQSEFILSRELQIIIRLLLLLLGVIQKPRGHNFDRF